MYRQVLAPISELLSGLGRSADRVEVSTVLWASIAAIVGDDDWTYLQIKYGTIVEIVRVVDVLASPYLGISRGYENTERTYHLVA